MYQKSVSRWYFGGLASLAAVCVTHPLDLLKVLLQTEHGKHFGVAGMTVRVITINGFSSFYNGFSGSLCRQLTYSMIRFSVYDFLKEILSESRKKYLPFHQKVIIGAMGGFAGGFVGTPADIVKIRMQNDVKMPLHMKRNYSHALDGMIRIVREERFRALFSGATLASSRGALMMVGQASCYDQVKEIGITSNLFSDSLFTHIIGLCATFLCQPLDVLKIRMMNNQDYYSVFYCVTETAKLGPGAFYKSLFPTALRLIPQTILTFVFLEQLRLRFGIPVELDQQKWDPAMPFEPKSAKDAIKKTGP
ncbi:mitochondrial dicarboxylate carrier-like isoform X2 [Monodelphis domestica]|uniref:mitochondrial dicarboxylate carrier-like isoform X2 n=1 Tax=Monodelphis domestica TaxID=13616 RepID=UPI0007B41082|nr:mitochondrial dicarboxylate carrier-like isoform X2 [Monodelphis domestica]